MCEFEKYGVIGDVYRPKEMATTMVEKSVLFIRFFSIDDANNAQVDLSKSRDANYIIRCHCGVWPLTWQPSFLFYSNYILFH